MLAYILIKKIKIFLVFFFGLYINFEWSGLSLGFGFGHAWSGQSKITACLKKLLIFWTGKFDYTAYWTCWIKKSHVTDKLLHV